MNATFLIFGAILLIAGTWIGRMAWKNTRKDIEEVGFWTVLISEFFGGDLTFAGILVFCGILITFYGLFQGVLA